jgi:hypothetical protein
VVGGEQERVLGAKEDLSKLQKGGKWNIKEVYFNIYKIIIMKPPGKINVC